MTTADRQTARDLRDAVNDIDADLSSALDELAELRQRIANLKEDRSWRVAALKHLKTK